MVENDNRTPRSIAIVWIIETAIKTDGEPFTIDDVMKRDFFAGDSKRRTIRRALKDLELMDWVDKPDPLGNHWVAGERVRHLDMTDAEYWSELFVEE